MNRPLNRFYTILPLAFALFGLPLILALIFANQVVQHLWVALTFFVIYELCVIITAFLTKVFQRMEMIWAARTAEWIDLQLQAYFSRYRRQYFQYLVYQHRDFDIKGLSTQGPYALELDQVFVDLSLEPTTPHKANIDPLQEPNKLPSDISSIRDFLSPSSSFKDIVIVGPPGSGKTTLLKQVTLALVVRGNLPNRPYKVKLKQKIPILLFLRDHVQAINNQEHYSIPDAVHDHLRRWEQPPTPVGWFERQLQKGNCLVMLDGLDEVGDSATLEQTAHWVQRQMIAYNKNRFVITSRPYGYRSNPLSGVTVLQVNPFSSEKVEQFITRWYLANEIMRKQKYDPGVRLLAEANAKDLIQRVQNTPALQQLTVNPLLLTMLATVHSFGGSLPNNLVSLYADICDVFLGKRQLARGQSIELLPRQKQEVLQPLAYYMMSHGQQDISLSDALIVIAEPLLTISPNISGESFLRMIENSSGLLLERAPGIYSFAFIGLQQYLTACYIRENNLETELAKRLEESWWHETISLYADMKEKISTPDLSLAVNYLRTIRQHPEQIFISIDNLLRKRAISAFTWISRTEQPEELARITAAFQQFLDLGNKRLSLIENTHQVLSLLQPTKEHFTHSNEVIVLLEALLSCLESQTLLDFTTRFDWNKLEKLEEPFLLTEVMQFSSQISDVQNQALKYSIRTDRREKELLLLEMLRLLERTEVFANQNLYLPYQKLALEVIAHWRVIITASLESLRGRVMLKARLLSEAYPYNEVIEVGFEISNLGDETAEEVMLHISNTNDYQVIYIDPRLDYLAPGTHGTLCCKLRLSEVRTIRLAFHVNFRQRGIDGEQKNDFAYILTFFNQTELFPFVPLEKNPYVTGRPLITDDVFFGRRQLIEDLVSNLQGRYQDNSIVLYGQRRTGKTSLLYALKRSLPKDRYISVLYEAAGVDSASTLFWGLATHIYDACIEAGIVLSQPAEEQYIAHPAANFENNFLREAIIAIKQRRLLLMVDEFESLEEAVREKLLPRTIFPFLRKIMQHQQQVSFIFCGTHQLQELTRQYWQTFFNAALSFHITFLDENATKALIQEPVRGHFTYDELALMRILKLTGSNPYFTQLICHSIVSLANRQRLGYITQNEVEDVIRQFIQNGNDHLDYILNESTPSERAVLLALAEETRQQRKDKVLWNQVETRLTEKSPIEHIALEEASITLEKRELITNDGPRISFTMGLIPEWLTAHYTWSNIFGRKR